MQALGNALRDARGLKPLIDPVHTIVTFDDLSCLRIPLGGPPWTGRDTALAAHTKGFINEDYAILRPLLHGTGRACRDAPWVLAVKTGHKDVGHPGKIVYQFGSDRDYLAESRACGEILIHLTMRLTAITTYTAL